MLKKIGSSVLFIGSVGLLCCKGNSNPESPTKYSVTLKSSNSNEKLYEIDFGISNPTDTLSVTAEKRNYIRLVVRFPGKWSLENFVINKEDGIKMGELSAEIESFNQKLEDYVDSELSDIRRSNPDQEGFRKLVGSEYFSLGSGRRFAVIRTRMVTSDGHKNQFTRHNQYVMKLNSHLVRFYLYERKPTDIQIADIKTILASFDGLPDL